MSCERDSNKIGQAGSLSGGIARLSNKGSHLRGVLAAGMTQTDRALDTVGRTTAPLTGLAMKVVGPKDARTKKALGAMAGVTAALAAARVGDSRRLKTLAVGGKQVGQTLLLRTYPALQVTQATEALTSAAGTGLGALSKTEEAGSVMQERRHLLFFKKEVPVSLWRSSLTPMLNRRDLIGTVQARNVVSSRGLMFTTAGKTWHQGTTVVNMPAGKRTITHLQSLSLPASHYFFDRPVSKEQVVGLASGQIKAADVPGFVGRVSAAESLCPAWAQSKQTLIKAHLHWPPEK